jgi:hypothetical protein
MDFLLGAEAERLLVRCGFSQYAPRDPSVQPACLAAGRMKPLEAALADIRHFLPLVRSDLMEIFLR